MTVRAVLPDTADEALLERTLPIFERYYAEESNVRTEPFPGARGLMRLHKRRMPLACVTNKPERFTRELLQRTEFAAFSADPMPLLFACERLAVAPQDARFIGDSLNDVVAALSS